MSTSLAMNAELSFKKRKTLDMEEALDKDWLRLSISTDSCYQPPPQKPQPLPPPQSPPHHPSSSLSQLMPPPSFWPPGPPPSFPFLLQWHQEGIFPQQRPGPQPSEPPSHCFSPPQQPQMPAEPPCYASLQPIFPKPQPQPQPQPQPHVDGTQTPERTPSSPEGQGQGSHRHRPSGAPRWRKRQKQAKEATVEPPYPWATSRRAKVKSMEELLSNNITVISGEVQCKHCTKQFVIEYDLRTKLSEVGGFIAERMETMMDRAPKEWSRPKELECKFCGYDKCEPVMTKKRSTNWLFLFLGQMIGYCNLTHLKYFCKHNTIHRTGAKDRLLYSVYMGLRRQLYPHL